MSLYVSIPECKCKNKITLQLKGVPTFMVGLWVSAGEKRYVGICVRAKPSWLAQQCYVKRGIACA